jgi:hypothetical protein
MLNRQKDRRLKFRLAAKICGRPLVERRCSTEDELEARVRCSPKCESLERRRLGRAESRRLLIQKPLEANENLANLFGSSEIGHGVGNRVMVFQTEQRSQFFLIEFIDANVHVMRQYEIEEHALLGVKAVLMMTLAAAAMALS